MSFSLPHRPVSCVFVCLAALALGSLSHRLSAQVFTTGFESPDWPTANPYYNVSAPITWSRTVTSGGLTVLFDMHRWGLWGRQALDENKTYFGDQAARCRYPQSSAGVTGNSVMAMRSVVNPRGVAFKMASTGTALSATDPRIWQLELWTVGISGPQSGQAQVHKVWTCLEGDLQQPRAYVREAVDLRALADGVYDIELRLTQHAASGSAFEALIDDLELFTGNSKVEPSPLPLSTLNALIDANPPRVVFDYMHRQGRGWITRDLDRHASNYSNTFAAAQDFLTPTVFTRFFRERIRKGIAEIGTMTPAADEIIIWKFYSSGYVVKTPKYTFGMDIQEGPNKFSFLSASATQIAMGMTDSEADDLAHRLDFAIYTHHHHDHVNYRFVDRMINAGKRVFGPAGMNPADPLDLREYHAIGGNGLYAGSVAQIEDAYDPGRSTIAKLGGNLDLEVSVNKGTQSSAAWMPPGPLPPPNPIDPVNYSYHIVTDNGINLINFGDVRGTITSNLTTALLDPVLMWIRSLSQEGKHVDIRLGQGPLIHIPVRLQSVIDAFRPIIRLPGHEWEMNHPGIGLYCRMFSTYRPKDEVSFPFVVGEHLRFRQFPSPPAVVPSSLTSTSVDIRFETTHTLTGTIRWGTAADFAAGLYPSSRTETAPATSHTITLSNLTPSTTYYFFAETTEKPLSIGRQDPTFTFTTPP